MKDDKRKAQHAELVLDYVAWMFTRIPQSPSSNEQDRIVVLLLMTCDLITTYPEVREYFTGYIAGDVEANGIRIIRDNILEVVASNERTQYDGTVN